MIESSQSFIIREECHKAAWQHGFRRVLGEQEGWAAFGSTTAQGTIWLAAESAHGPWFLALDHPGVVAELALPATDFAGPARARYAFPTLTALYDILARLYQLSTSLPEHPMHIFRLHLSEEDCTGYTPPHSISFHTRMGTAFYSRNHLTHHMGSSKLLR